MTQGVSPGGTGAGSPALARDAHHLPRCSWAQPWSCKSLGSPWHRPRCRVGNGQCHPPARHTQRTPAHRTRCTGTSHAAHRHITQQHIAHRTPARHTPCTGTLHTVPTPPRIRRSFSSLSAPASPHPHLYQSIRQIKLFAKYCLRVCFIPALGKHDAAEPPRLCHFVEFSL